MRVAQVAYAPMLVSPSDLDDSLTRHTVRLPKQAVRRRLGQFESEVRAAVSGR